ncbi:hypothetical protein V6N12_063726 [Hibiscus sabdariffa]|uniref:NAD-dependent epimerase/dehydratase domain-containing protein n=1 Tax=Hibiscus sabdariffa TaxID=183260 RepID=A0ABR2FCJ7_9ROSI
MMLPIVEDSLHGFPNEEMKGEALSDNIVGLGVIASHVCNMLINNYLDYKLVVLNKLDYCSNLKNPNPLRSSPNFKFIKGDIASDDLVHIILQAEFIHTIMHFVAHTH